MRRMVREHVASGSARAGGRATCAKGTTQSSAEREARKEERRRVWSHGKTPAKPAAARDRGTPGSCAAAGAGAGVEAAVVVVHKKYSAVVRVRIRTGKFHVVRRLLAAVGLPVTQLKRVAYGRGVLSLSSMGVEEANTHRRVPCSIVAHIWQQLQLEPAAPYATHTRRVTGLDLECARTIVLRRKLLSLERRLQPVPGGLSASDRARLAEWLAAVGFCGPAAGHAQLAHRGRPAPRHTGCLAVHQFLLASLLARPARKHVSRLDLCGAHSYFHGLIPGHSIAATSALLN